MFRSHDKDYANPSVSSLPHHDQFNQLGLPNGKIAPLVLLTLMAKYDYY